MSETAVAAAGGGMQRSNGDSGAQMITMNMISGANFVQINQPIQLYGQNVQPYHNVNFQG